MCRNIRTLHNFEPAATEDEIQASSLQYVRKISGSTKPSQANQEAFDDAVEEIAEVTRSCSAAWSPRRRRRTARSRPPRPRPAPKPASPPSSRVPEKETTRRSGSNLAMRGTTPRAADTRP